MPLTLPDLDDRRFDDLVAEARALIPSLDPQWTNHNLSDPGITLVELFAYISEILMYRLNRVTDANTRSFLKLLNGSAPDLQPTGDLTADVRKSIAALRRPERAVTPADFELLAKAASPDVKRVACVARRRPVAGDPVASSTVAPGHISVVIVAASGLGDTAFAALLAQVFTALDPARLLTTKLHVVGASRLKIAVNVNLVLEADAVPDVVSARARSALGDFLDPLTGGPDGQGWPFGRAVYVSEIYGLLDQVPGVDYVERSGTADELSVVAPDRDRLVRSSGGAMVGARRALTAVSLDPGQLVEFAGLSLPDGWIGRPQP